MKVKLKGKGKWISKQYKEWERPDGSVDKRWSMLFYPDPEALEEIRDLQMKGLKNRLRKDEDGVCISFGRPVERTFGNRLTKYSPPKIVNEKDEDVSDTVGNGSEVTIELEVYEHSVPNSRNKSVAARWEGVTITKLVERPSPPTQNNTSVEDTSEPLF